MSVGRRVEDNSAKTPAQLYAMLGEGDTAELYAQKVKLDTGHDIPDGGGISVSRKTVYIDSKLYQAIMQGRIKVAGMTAEQIVEAIVEHEHTEKSIADGDNPVDTYEPAHRFANAAEDECVKAAGGKPVEYNDALEDGLDEAEHQDPNNVPKDLWCGPYRDDPDANDKRVMKRFRALGVEDAFKQSKKSAHYGIGGNECRNCAYFDRPADRFGLAKCEKVGGLVRIDRQCDWWRDKSKRSVRDDVEAAYEEHEKVDD